MNAAKAGAIAALVWAAVEPFDQRMLRHDYSDVAVLGKAVTPSRAWPLAGLAMHAANGAVFGVAYAQARRRGTSAVTMALAEHTVLFPLGAIVDRRHPARGTKGLAPLWSKRAFAQATFRHLLFGALLCKRDLHWRSRPSWPREEAKPPANRPLWPGQAPTGVSTA